MFLARRLTPFELPIYHIHERFHFLSFVCLFVFVCFLKRHFSSAEAFQHFTGVFHWQIPLLLASISTFNMKVFRGFVRRILVTSLVCTTAGFRLLDTKGGGVF